MRRRALSLALASVLLAAAPTAASAAPAGGPKPPPRAVVKIRIGHLHGGRAAILSSVPVVGSVTPFAPGERIEVDFFLDGRPLLTRRVEVRGGRGGAGSFETSVIVRQGGRYAASARLASTRDMRGDSTVRKRWRVSFPALAGGSCGRVVRAFKAGLARLGYVSGGGSCFDERTAREVLAYRKVNGMALNGEASAPLVEAVFSGRGGYHVRYPQAGEHAEVPLAKQVLVLARGARPFAIYPVSTGKPSTPTVTGHYHFYLRSPGYNSEGMYYSFYWYEGYAVHGYAEVPDYPASHGCVRTYIADQPRIYDELHYGESIFVF